MSERSARCDVIVAVADDALEDAKKDKLVKAATVTPVFRNALVLVGREPPAAADVKSALAGKKLAIADPERDLAGSHGLEALERSQQGA